MNVISLVKFDLFGHVIFERALIHVFYAVSSILLLFQVCFSGILFLFFSYPGGGSPMPPISSASSGFSDDDSLHCDTNCGFSLPQFIEIVRSKGRAGLIAEYEEIKSRSPDGTFQHAKCVNYLLHLIMI